MDLIRYTPGTCDVIQRADGSTSLGGYAVVFWDGTDATQYHYGNNAVERMTREAFAEADFTGTVLRFNHSRDFELGNKDTGLSVGVDNKGVWYDHPYDADDVDMKKVRQKIAKKLIRGSSIQAHNCRYKLTVEGDTVVRWITGVGDVEDVGPVDRPATPGTTALVRQMTQEDVKEAEEFAARHKRTEEIKARLHK